MADVELASVNNSGNLTNFQKGGIDVGDKLLSSDEVDVKVKVIDDKLVNYINKDGSTIIEKMLFQDLTGLEPTYEKGNVFYANGTLNIQGEFPEQTTQVGEELPITIVNATGATITNGQVVRYSSVSAGEAAMVLAKADSFNNARGIAVATMDIPLGSRGKVVTYGKVSDINLSSFNDGDQLYLSDTIAGGLTVTPPEIITAVGVVFNNDAVNGVLFVKPASNINLPTAVASIKGQNSPTYTLAAGVAEIVQEYISEVSLYAITNTLAGTLSLTHAGIYELLLTVGGNISDEEIDITFELYDVTNAVVKETFTFNSGRASTPASVPFAQTMSTVFNSLTANTDYVIRLMSATNEVIVLNNISASLKSIQIT